MVYETRIVPCPMSDTIYYVRLVVVRMYTTHIRTYVRIVFCRWVLCCRSDFNCEYTSEGCGCESVKGVGVGVRV